VCELKNSKIANFLCTSFVDIFIDKQKVFKQPEKRKNKNEIQVDGGSWWMLG